MSLVWRRLSKLAVVAALFYIAFSIHSFKPFPFPYPGNAYERNIHNATLGFEGIAVVSTGWSWRSEGLLDAANFTGLKVDIPNQPEWSPHEVNAFRGLDDVTGEKLGPGETQCWLGHINVWSHAVEHNWTTLLVLEDDVDWDISIKQQLALVAPAIRKITKSTIYSTEQPYGDAWDLLWVGHCGDFIPPNTISLRDESLPVDLNVKYRENDGRFTVLTTEPQQRLVHMTATPMCTYAYALTGDAARTLYLYSKNWAFKGVITKDLAHWCQAGFLKCVTINPELFHHHKKAGMLTSEIAIVEGWPTNVWNVDFTANIKHSARCNSRSPKLVSCIDEFGDSEEKGRG
ncbi:hypothetical protein F5B21DRAFT_483204 [Xylaria acuta]|nr:hypothetical protein F5B21DRAFT_483204 [Xylaria acuta]